MEVGFGPSHIVLDGDPAPPHQKRETTPNFQSMSVVAKWLDGATWYGGRPQPRRHCVRWEACSPPKEGGTAPQFWPTCCGQTAAWIKVPLGTGVGLSTQATLCYMRTQLPLKKGHTTPPPFSAPVCCGQTAAGWIKMPLDREVDVGKGDIVLHGDPVPPKGTQPPIFGPCLSGQTAGWMKIPFGTEVGLGPGDIVLNGDSAPQERGTAPPHFSAHVYCSSLI